jgi:hypothetical protein
MATNRPVRIARKPSGVEATHASPPGRPGVEYRSNAAGFQRAIRVFLLYLIAVVAMYGYFLWLIYGTTGGGLSGNSLGVATFSAAAAGLVILGIVLVMGEYPRGVEIESTQVVVLGRWGGRFVLPPAPELQVRLLRRHHVGLLSPEPTVTVEVHNRGGRRRTYIVAETLFPGEPIRA